MYHSTTKPVQTRVRFDAVVRDALFAKLREDRLYSAGLKKGRIPLAVRPFEIATLKLLRKDTEV